MERLGKETDLVMPLERNLCDAFFLRLKGVEREGPLDANGLETSHPHGILLESKSHGRSRGTPGLDTDEFSADKCHRLYLLGKDWFGF